MPKLPFDLKGFVKVDANRDHTVFQSEEGHLIYVANKSVAKDVHDAMRHIPVQKMSQGGVVRRPVKEEPKPTLPGQDKDKKAISASFNNAMGWKRMADGGVVEQDIRSQVLRKQQEIQQQLLQQNASLPYQTNLSPQQQAQFALWAAQNNVPVDLSKASDYDMTGFYQAMQQGQAASAVSPVDNRMHYTDTFKTPLHETLSAESKYAPPGAPSWQGNMLVNPNGTPNAIELPSGVEKLPHMFGGGMNKDGQIVQPTVPPAGPAAAFGLSQLPDFGPMLMASAPGGSKLPPEGDRMLRENMAADQAFVAQNPEAYQQAPVDISPAPTVEEPSNYAIPKAPEAAPQGLTPVAPGPTEQALSAYGQATQDEAKAKGVQAADELQAMQDQEKQKADLSQRYMANLDKITGASLELEKRLSDPKEAINPQHYMEGQGAYGRLLTGIGLALGGAPAREFLQKQIDNDILAQQKNIDNKNNLLSQKLKIYGDMQTALDATRLDLNQVLLDGVKKATLKNTGPVAVQHASVLVQEKTLEQAKLLESIASKVTQQQMMGLASRAADPYKAQVEAMEATNPERAKDMRSRLVPGVGFANTMEQAKELSNLRADSDSARQSIDRLKQIANTPGKSFDLGLRREADSLVTLLTASLNKPITGGGPLQSTERELLNNLSSNPTSIFSLDSVNKKALDTLKGAIDRKESSALKYHGLSAPSRANGPTPQGLKGK